MPEERLRIKWCLNLPGEERVQGTLSSSSLCASIAAQIAGTISVLLPSQIASCWGLGHQPCMGRAADPASAAGRLRYWEGHTAARVQPLPPLPEGRLKATGQPRRNTAGFAPFTMILEPGRLPALLSLSGGQMFFLWSHLDNDGMNVPTNMTRPIYPVLSSLPYPPSYSLKSPTTGFLWLAEITLAEWDAQALQLLKPPICVSGPPQTWHGAD